MKVSEEWYKGTADAVFQNLDILSYNGHFSVAAIFAGDHIFKIEISQMYCFHRKRKSDFTISVLAVPVSECANNFGVVEVDDYFRVIGFEEDDDLKKGLSVVDGVTVIPKNFYFC